MAKKRTETVGRKVVPELHPSSVQQLLLAIFPRGQWPSEQRQKNEKASLLSSQIADGKMIHYLDINSRFLTADGELKKDIMPDFLHPSAKGYQIWADAIEPKVAKLMAEK